MNYISYFFNMVFYTLNNLKFPFPISSDKVFYFNGFTILMCITIISIIVYFISKILDLDIYNFTQFLYDQRNESAIKTYKAVHRFGKKSYSDLPDKPKYYKDNKNTWRLNSAPKYYKDINNIWRKK